MLWCSGLGCTGTANVFDVETKFKKNMKKHKLGNIKKFQMIWRKLRIGEEDWEKLSIVIGLQFARIQTYWESDATGEKSIANFGSQPAAKFWKSHWSSGKTFSQSDPTKTFSPLMNINARILFATRICKSRYMPSTSIVMVMGQERLKCSFSSQKLHI